MSNKKIDLLFADGAYSMRLGLAQINEIEKKCGFLGAVYARLLQGIVPLENGTLAGLNTDAAWGINDIVEPIRQGLIGGGRGVVDGADVKVTPHRANQLIENYVLAKPLGQSWTLAVSILTQAVVGFDPPKKHEPGQDPAAES